MSMCCYCSLSSADGAMDTKIKCMGPCNQFIHLNCVKMTVQTKRICEDLPELHFYCKFCAVYSNAGVANALNSFSANISQLSEALKPLTSLNMNTLVSNFIAKNSNNDVNSPSKRRRTDGDLIRFTDSATPRTGTKNSEALSTVPLRKSFVISHLANSTTTDMIEKYIKDNVGDVMAIDARCTTLLPVGKQPADLSYISFRVSASEKVYDMINRTEFWPKGVQLREFVFKPKKRSSNIITPVFMDGI